VDKFQIGVVSPKFLGKQDFALDIEEFVLVQIVVALLPHCLGGIVEDALQDVLGEGVGIEKVNVLVNDYKSLENACFKTKEPSELKHLLFDFCDIFQHVFSIK